MRSSAEDTAAIGRKKPQAAAKTPLDASLNLISYSIVTDNYLEHHLEKKSENRHSGDVLSMGFKKSS